ncbi:SRPBCC family protein [Flavobacterium sp. K77]|uniref:SRPBCC family protein n=1 Tax=Flavobacterium sp. K77 TaxID=2910676 RepID=UPI001F45D2F3|nr:SRPBCC family protein [Flavobacterium sp. K77]MCF6141029.1 SRPBCC family protein [Flavobacterium sp. K77]
MRILKYLFLLLLLSFVAATVFVATQKGNFVVERSQVIPTPRNTVFNYINDLKNWEDFTSWTIDQPETTFSYSPTSAGPGASYSWSNSSKAGSIRNVTTKENDSIAQKMDYDGTETDVTIKFKDTLGGTKVTWKSQGKMSFSMKIYATFNGGAEKLIGSLYEKSLANLNKTLNYELKTFAATSNGIVKKAGTFYLKQTISTKTAQIYKNARIIIYKLNTFCKQNNIELNGKPFLIFHAYDSSKDVAKISFCVPIKYQIATSMGSDILVDKLETFDAVKTTLLGDYVHLNKAYLKSKNYINTNKIAVGNQFLKLEVLNKSRFEIKNPSKWETEIYIPMMPKVVEIPTTNPIEQETSATTTPKSVQPKAVKEQDLSEF